ncbi:hypothetical protein NC797_15050 [Aquibacillus sp. 3ASR75-11]|uniref:Uncharacterized protein n=2 Tax=Bacillaceae TaxID=186817 RepID=A0A9X3WYV2_9BACI|nr:hypothetical protein [Terrihalobacillus insolitus]MDC3415102.1 hypothetical protein [Terrihalobacillus insolitus]MDC3425824.1 hypothetical protein [Terrihalobacillus insolitus]
MPQSIIMQRLISFPQEFPVRTNTTGTAETRLMFTSEIRELGLSEYTEETINKYQVLHPIGNSFEGKGIIEDGSEHELIAVSREESFNIFKTQDDFLLFTDAKKAIIEHGIKRLTDGTYNHGEGNIFKTEKLTINLSSLKEEIQDGALGRIRGGWWRGLQIADVEVAYLGGGTVTESYYWNTYEESEGIISALRLDIPNLMDDENEVLKVLLTKEGNLVVYKDIPTERHLLEVATTIFNLAKNHLE